MARIAEGPRKRVIAGSMLGAGVILALLLFLIANYFGSKYSQRFDWTEHRLFTLSEKTTNLLGDLSQVQLRCHLPAEPLPPMVVFLN